MLLGQAAKAWLLIVAFMYKHSAISAWQAETDASKLQFKQVPPLHPLQLHRCISKHAEVFDVMDLHGHAMSGMLCKTETAVALGFIRLHT